QFHQFITTNFKWLYILASSLIVVCIIWLMFSRYARSRLGPADSKPEYSTLAWFAMLFTAGMGIGLVFFAVCEPVSHFTAPPAGEAGTGGASRSASHCGVCHWGLHPWAIYIVV